VQESVVFNYRSPHFCFPWRRPSDYHAICCMDGKRIQCLQIVSQMYPSTFNSFPVIQSGTTKKSPFSRTAAHIFVSPGDAPEAITLNVVWMDYLAACAHLTITVSEIQRDIGRKSSIFSYPLAFDAPVKGVSVGIAALRLVWKN